MNQLILVWQPAVKRFVIIWCSTHPPHHHIYQAIYMSRFVYCSVIFALGLNLISPTLLSTSSLVSLETARSVSWPATPVPGDPCKPTHPSDPNKHHKFSTFLCAIHPAQLVKDQTYTDLLVCISWMEVELAQAARRVNMACEQRTHFCLQTSLRLMRLATACEGHIKPDYKISQ